MLKNYCLKDMKLLHINKASATIELDGMHVFITKRVMNKFLNEGEILGVITQNTHPVTGRVTNWLSVLSIF